MKWNIICHLFLIYSKHSNLLAELSVSRCPVDETEINQISNQAVPDAIAQCAAFKRLIDFTQPGSSSFKQLNLNGE